ncbi:hypothetical protein K0M31_016650 [Melipona bicolor]|uniref:Uncharacterized protein n=1 Tax=Melipona bicolor TaxID=60889 RepID=A0AA40FEB9_9HYME|nr:hypothetical protein K0M31_016650 [Melipona bicolor]
MVRRQIDDCYSYRALLKGLPTTLLSTGTIYVDGDLRTKAYVRVRKYVIEGKREKLDAENSMVTKFQGKRVGYIAYDTAERGATVSLVDICIVGEISPADHKGERIQRSTSSNLIRLLLGRQHRDSNPKAKPILPAMSPAGLIANWYCEATTICQPGDLPGSSIDELLRSSCD